MRICVVSGSPRGSNSVTLHTVLYLQKLFPRHEFTVIHAGKTIKALERDFFFGVGGMKIFRDMIWLMQGLMRADHKFYKTQGQYDFPQKKPGTVLKMKLVGGLFASPSIRKKMGGKMDDAISGPYKKVVDAAEPRGDAV